MKVIFGTTNKRKLEDLEHIVKKHGLNLEILCLADIGWDRGEINENGLTIEENSLIKANAIHDFCVSHGINYPIITDDSGLFIKALNGEPGIHTARYAEQEMLADPTLPAHEGTNKIIRLMQGEKDRSAIFRCAVTCMFADGSYKQFGGKTEGTIAEKVLEPIKKPYSYCVFLLKNTGKSLHETVGKDAENTYRMVALSETLQHLNSLENQNQPN